LLSVVSDKRSGKPPFYVRFKPASENQAGDFEATYHGLGTTGPVQTRALPHFTAVEELIQEALAQKGLKKIADPYQGDVSFGFSRFANHLFGSTKTEDHVALLSRSPVPGGVLATWTQSGKDRMPLLLTMCRTRAVKI
jgi:hypothetical protein